MKKRILSALLVLTMLINISGCNTEEKEPESAETTEETTTSATTTATAATTTIATEDEAISMDEPAETTTPATTTTAKPVETTKPAEPAIEPIQSSGEYKNVTITYKSDVDKYIVEWDDVKDARLYRLDVDADGYTDTGNICDDLRQSSLGAFDSELVEPGDVVYVRIKCTVKEKDNIFEGKFVIPERIDPFDAELAATELGSFSEEPSVDWDGSYFSVCSKSVPGAEKYHISVDSKGYKDNGDLLTSVQERSRYETETFSIGGVIEKNSLPEEVYIRLTAYKGERSTSTEFKYNTYSAGIYGNAVHIDGKTVVVSIFTDDPTTKWTDSAADKKTMDEVWESMRCATEWLTRSTAKYGAETEFIWDWKKDSSLKHTASFDMELDIDDFDARFESAGESEYESNTAINAIYNAKQLYITEMGTIADELLEKYDADNIVYIFIVNTTDDNKANSHAISASRYISKNEYITVFVREEGHQSRANTYAHEILHLFGTPDLYCENDTIPQAYVDHMDAIDCNSIMYYGQSKDDITREFTDLEAYYTGLINYHEDVEKWGLGKSDFYVD